MDSFLGHKLLPRCRRPGRTGITGRNHLRRLAVRVRLVLSFKGREIFLDCARLTFGLSPYDLVRRLAVVPTSIGFHDAGVDSEDFAFDQAGRHASRNNALEQVAKNITLPEPVQPVLREGRVVRNLVVEIEPAEPTVSQVQLDLLGSIYAPNVGHSSAR